MLFLFLLICRWSYSHQPCAVLSPHVVDKSDRLQKRSPGHSLHQSWGRARQPERCNHHRTHWTCHIQGWRLHVDVQVGIRWARSWLDEADYKLFSNNSKSLVNCALTGEDVTDQSRMAPAKNGVGAAGNWSCSNWCGGINWNVQLWWFQGNW